MEDICLWFQRPASGRRWSTGSAGWGSACRPDWPATRRHSTWRRGPARRQPVRRQGPIQHELRSYFREVRTGAFNPDNIIFRTRDGGHHDALVSVREIFYICLVSLFSWTNIKQFASKKIHFYLIFEWHNQSPDRTKLAWASMSDGSLWTLWDNINPLSALLI